MSIYEIGILGDVTDAERQTLTNTIGALIAEFGLVVGNEVVLHNGTSLSGRDRHAACAITYFCGQQQEDQEAAQQAIASSVPVIPTVGPMGDFGRYIPKFMQAANGLRRRTDDPDMKELAVALLECVGLLRRQRRVFVSYRRVESRSAAVQLHDLLSSRGFDVFLDTHDIRPGEPFQDVLWHRLCDSDVMVMLDTPTYFESKWTRQELGRARAKEIHVLRVVWPEHTPNKQTDFSETIYLDAKQLSGKDGPITDSMVDVIILAVEYLRSRSIASRYMSITGKFRAEVEKIGGTIEGVGAHRAISFRLPDNRKIWAYPVVGVPTAELLNDVADKAVRAEQHEIPILVYDGMGIRGRWIAHLKWLDENIRTVRAIPVSDAGWTLAGWED
ncbi:MAG: toll/interleukin-1 receptor domain-containing protein [Acidithiobacillus ferrivorans]